ncbi:LysR family transcriptional regulator [Rhizobium lusitanum]|uniref:LysR family transcriptional regulator n=1 Tax=Rhizobium lusitanum TaxID=293958 RepID=UPI001572D7D8|nr:LysR family transcriptional regulator [Rhizobium lusitanum]NTJ11528.1 LysR family transcriptional regulator [Rhizobium lusitanum]
MSKDKMNDMIAFLAVARLRSFTRAAGELGVTPSALSHAVRRLENRLGLRLLSRTTRNVAATEAGERLVRSVTPHFEQIEANLEMLSALRDTPAGTVRIVCTEQIIDMIFRPKLEGFLAAYPDIKLEFSIDYGLTDIVEHRFDAGVRFGESVGKDMIAVRIGPDTRLCVIGAPAYFKRLPPPRTPQDLMNHNCINIRLPTAGGLYAWEFKNGAKDVSVRVDGQLTFNSITPLFQAALDGLGLGYVPLELARPYIERGLLQEAMADWCPIFPGFHLYYPSRRQPTPAFTLFVETFRYRP